MKIELTPAEAMDVYDALTDFLVKSDNDCSDTLINAYNKLRSAIIGNTANINAFEKWYAAQHAKIDALNTAKSVGVNGSHDPV